MLDFDCDRRAKDDFTASTLAYLTTIRSFSSVTFYEEDRDGNIIPYGSISASTTSHYDIWMDYITSAWTKRYVFELKERTFANDKYPEGAFINREKCDMFKTLVDEGIVPMWAELYTDGKIRIWNLQDFDPSEASSTTKSIRRISIDPYSTKRPQERLLLPLNKGIIIDRL